MERDNLTAKQIDGNGLSKYSIFLPALSSFYATYIGKQQALSYVDPARVPAKFENGIEGMNWLNADQGYFTYKWSLYSAGHANLDVTQDDPREYMITKRDRKNTFVVADSGGFQVGKGVWEGNWTDFNDAKCAKRRTAVLKWIDTIADYGMTLDIPGWTYLDPIAAKKTGIYTYQDAVNVTHFNNEYFIKNRNGGAKFLNVLQGSNHTEADQWYHQMKKYSDPKQYPNEHFNGWGMGGQNMADPDLILRRLVELRHDGLLESGVHDWMHFLGTSKLEWAVLLTDIQNAIRKYHNPTFTISFDCASPFLATANGQLYHQTIMEDRKKWTYKMSSSVDDRKYATDSRSFSDAVLQDKIFSVFEESPISARMKVSDVCIYKPGDLNKIGKEGKTSWDSFSYALQMGHNVHRHLYAVQEANRRYLSNGTEPCPHMLVDERHDRMFFRDIIDAIFATSSKGDALALIKHFHIYWTSIIGTRGFSGKRSINASTQFTALFEEDAPPVEEHHIDDSGLDETGLEMLEDGKPDTAV